MSKLIKTGDSAKFKKFIKFGLNDCNEYVDYDLTNLGMVALQNDNQSLY